jgi:hypothetical protein
MTVVSFLCWSSLLGWNLGAKIQCFNQVFVLSHRTGHSNKGAKSQYDCRELRRWLLRGGGAKLLTKLNLINLKLKSYSVARKLLCMLIIIQVCESTFFMVNLVKLKWSSTISGENLLSELRFKIYVEFKIYMELWRLNMLNILSILG